ncbi:GNAT family N-acetyltransferase [Paeniglutamicibacter cryotolerans]|uniref:GNAT superfamily N-acetyltransferase n=1 Tax=Paeniglutamicibacter cryotolerans TaxID=670079 RepID=A0A839QMV4_9MICC|nr:GNAT family N-acetyltransferase [Paeniglutamicibacter cryotolerans]MBB2996094.1 GNAT superfamily N-acetyltransferase [Paeniglutamicibacter cryotolerans]
MSSLSYRPWTEGDDLALLQVWGDPASPHAHQDRTMFRPSTDRPWSRCIVGEDQGVPVAAAVVFESSLHPDRLWLHVEVARDHRRQGIATEMVGLLRAEVPPSGVTALKSRYTTGPVDKGSAAAGFAASIGQHEIQRSRDVVVEPGGLKLPLFNDDGLTLDDAATGSVELTQLVTAFYNATHEWDRAAMTLGMAQKMLLNDATGAKGVVMLRDKPKEGGGKILSFAISYEPTRIDAPADVLLGWDPELADADAAEAIRGLLAMIVHQYPVKLEVDDSMVLLSGLVDALIGAGHATVISETHIMATA